jgi:hypothetical protein
LDKLTPWKSSSSSTEVSGLGMGFLAESDQLPSSTGLGITGAVANHSPNANSTLIHKWGPGGSSALQKSNSLTGEDLASTSSTGTGSGGVSSSGTINGGSYTWGSTTSSSSITPSVSVKTNPVPVPLTSGPSNDGLSTSPSSIRSDKTTSSVLSAVAKAMTSGPASGAKGGNYVQIKETSPSPDGKFLVDDL